MGTSTPGHIQDQLHQHAVQHPGTSLGAINSPDATFMIAFLP